MKHKLFITVFLTLVLIGFVGARCNRPTLEEQLENIEKKVGGSCNRIEVSGEGYCADYIGEDAHSASPCTTKYYSKEPCPPSSMGGCAFNPGTSKEKIQWSYDYGEYPVDQDEVENVIKPSCLLQEGAQWRGPSQ